MIIDGRDGKPVPYDAVLQADVGAAISRLQRVVGLHNVAYVVWTSDARPYNCQLSIVNCQFTLRFSICPEFTIGGLGSFASQGIWGFSFSFITIPPDGIFYKAEKIIPGNLTKKSNFVILFINGML